MDNFNELMTIAEFAAAASVSQQAVYKRLKTDKVLQEHLQIIGKQKYINSSALDLFDKNIITNNENKSNNNLSQEIIERDKIIARQAEQIEKLQNHIIEQSKELTEILKNQNQIQANFQLLLAQTNQTKSESIEQTEDIGVEQPVVEQLGNQLKHKKFSLFNLFRDKKE